MCLRDDWSVMTHGLVDMYQDCVDVFCAFGGEKYVPSSMCETESMHDVVVQWMYLRDTTMMSLTFELFLIG